MADTHTNISYSIFPPRQWMRESNLPYWLNVTFALPMGTEPNLNWQYAELEPKPVEPINAINRTTEASILSIPSLVSDVHLNFHRKLDDVMRFIYQQKSFSW